MIIIDDLYDNGQMFTFPGGEEFCNLTPADTEEWQVALRNPSSRNLLGLAMVKEATKWGLIDLTLPYFPGARQDRRAHKGTPLSVKVYADFINSLEFRNVHIWDPHSDVVTALVDHVFVYDHIDWFEEVLRTQFSRTLFLFPDVGAEKRYRSQYQGHGSIVCCSKKRDTATGRLSGFSVPDISLYRDYSIWIIDDIIDGGGTFLGIREEMAKQGEFGFVGLAATHGIFSKGVELLTNAFDQVATTDSIYSKTKRHPELIASGKLIEVAVIQGES